MAAPKSRKLIGAANSPASSSNVWSNPELITLAAVAAAYQGPAAQAAERPSTGDNTAPFIDNPAVSGDGTVTPGTRGGTDTGDAATPSFTPTDAQYANQWHLFDMGNLQKIWDDYNGSGINVGVYDSGVQNHFDLDAHYNAALHINIGGTIYDGRLDITDGHGTSAAGLIGAEANGLDAVGVAFNANLTGVNVFASSGTNANLYINAGSPTGFYEAIAQSDNFDVVNNSWGSSPAFAQSQNQLAAGSFTENVLNGWIAATENGRGGLGTVIVKSSGNDNFVSNGDNLNSARQTITVAALGSTGAASSYSNYGADILVSAGGGDYFEVDGVGLFVTSTDLLGTAGYNISTDPTGSYSYTDSFGGTSAAGPIVAGVVALMLDANPNLGWRDVQNILAASSTYTGDPSTLTATESNPWFNNKANTWNGGGYHFSEDYGYGQVNAYNAVRMAEAWLTMNGPAATSANENSFSALATLINKPISDNSTTEHQLVVSGASQDIDHLQITVSLQHSFFGALSIVLISPEGTEVMLVAPNSHNGNTAASSGLQWAFGIEALRGENLNGTWTLRVTDTDGFGDTGTLNAMQITAFGSDEDTKDVYTFTDEFAAMLGADSSRGTITDTNGGLADWINAAAVTANATIDLRGTGFNSSIGGGIVVLNNIENAYSGDGNDTLNGNGSANAIYGGRGNDSINGFGGIDFLYGGLGNDTFYVDTFDDEVFDYNGQGYDVIFSSSSYTLGSEAIEELKAANQSSTLAINLSGNGFVQLISGNNGDNTLNGNGGADQLYGRNGNDIYIVDVAGDQVFETTGQGTDSVFAKASYTLANGQSIETLATTAQSGTTAINLTGNNLNQTVNGNNGANTVNGGGGTDTLFGRQGNDIFVFNTALGASNIDTIGDYNVAADTIRLSQAIFTGIGATLDAGEFVIGSAALDANDRIIYNSATGALIFDSNGSTAGGAQQFATLSTGLALVSTEFVMIA